MKELKLPELKKVVKLDEYIKFKIGDEYNGNKVLPKDKKPNILLLTDDIRYFSGIATQSRMLVEATCHKFNWLNLGASVNPPNQGKLFDISNEVIKSTGIEDASVKVIPSAGYGDANKIYKLIEEHNIDAIFFVTDPRYYIWLFEIKQQLNRKNIPLFYWNIWDNTPTPTYNRPYYKSANALLGISKQTVQINKTVLGEGNYYDGNVNFKDTDKPIVKYLKHGLNPNIFHPITDESPTNAEFIKFKEHFKNTTNIDLEDPNKFIMFWNNRNIKRKQGSSVILAYRKYMDSLTEEERKNKILVLHTDPVDDYGTDLPAVIAALCPDYPVIFSGKKTPNVVLNFYYNIADVVINISNAEGFGLTTCEGLMAGTPILVNVTGGLQDQCGFMKDGKYITIDDLDDDWMTNATHKYDECGEWAFPVFPKVRALEGSPLTPYIYADYPSIDEVVLQIKAVSDLSREQRKSIGLKGREYLINEGFTNTAVGNEFINFYDKFMNKWKYQEEITIEEPTLSSKISKAF